MPILQNRDACQKGLAIHTALQHCVTAQFIDPNTQPAYFKVCDYGKVVRHFIKRSEHVGGCGIIGPYVYRNVKVEAVVANRLERASRVDWVCIAAQVPLLDQFPSWFSGS